MYALPIILAIPTLILFYFLLRLVIYKIKHKEVATKGFYDPKTYLWVTQEEATERLEHQRKAEIVMGIVILLSPLWAWVFLQLVWAVIVAVGTILFCIEILAKGSGIK